MNIRFASMVATGAVVACILPAIAMADLTITFDENGNGMGNLGGTSWILRGQPAIDPWGLRAAIAFDLDQAPFLKALTYPIGTLSDNVAPKLTEGDVLLFTPAEGFSDIIRFNYGVNGKPPFGTIVVYSDGDDGSPSLADVSAQEMPVRLTNSIWLPEQSTANGWSGLKGYTPQGPGWLSYDDAGNPIRHRLAQPGYMPGYTVTYDFTSDPVPVPGAVVLAALGLGLVGWVRWRLA